MMTKRGYINIWKIENIYILMCLFVVCTALSYLGLSGDTAIHKENNQANRTYVIANKLEKERLYVYERRIASEQPDQRILEISAPEPNPKPTNRWGIENISEEERTLLAKVIYLEGHSTGLSGCQKVAVVIFNRYANGSFFGGQAPSLTSVVSAPGQFSVYRKAATDPNLVPTEQELTAIDSVLNGSAPEEILDGQWLYFNGDGQQNHFR